MPNPPLDDEFERRRFWEKHLGQYEDREDLIRNAAQALALRDAEIANLLKAVAVAGPDKEEP